MKMHVRPRNWLWIVVGVACVGVGVRLWITDQPLPAKQADGATVARPAAKPAAAEQPVLAFFSAWVPHQESSRKSLDELRATLAGCSKVDAVNAITSFLRGGKDKDTGLPFEIGRPGNLTGWPTFRVFLLDALAAIDPQAAAEVSREILASPTTPDEWAVALRNLGRLERTPEGDAILQAKTVELIQHPQWMAAPSVGYLNAFDVLVHTEATAATPLLSGLIQRKDRADLAHAGFLTLDRLVQRQPAQMLEQLAADRALQQSRPEMTAQQFARADLRDPAQQSIVRNWLLDPARTQAELRSFAATYPNNNQFVSNNLLTGQGPTPGNELAAHDQAALEIVSSWAQDPEFQPVKPHLQAVAARLDRFVRGKPADLAPESK